MQYEIFYTTPEYNMTYIINEIHHICLPRQSISMKDKQISDLSTKVVYLETQLKAAQNEIKKLAHNCEKSNNEMIEAKINAASSSSKYDELYKIYREKLVQKSNECVIKKCEPVIKQTTPINFKKNEELTPQQLSTSLNQLFFNFVRAFQ